MHPFTHSQTHRLLATSQSHSTLVQSHPRHPSQLPGGPAEHTLQLFPTGRCPLLPLGGLNEPTQHPLPTASLPQCQWPQREAEAGGIVCNLTVWTLASDRSARDTPRQPNRGGMIELLLFGVGVWWLRCHIISHHCSLLCEVCLAGLWCN